MNRVEAAPTPAPAEVALKGRPAELEGAAPESLGPDQARLVLDRTSADPGDGSRAQSRPTKGYRPRDLLVLQRVAGNRAVSDLIRKGTARQVRDGPAVQRAPPLTHRPPGRLVKSKKPKLKSLIIDQPLPDTIDAIPSLVKGM